MTDKGKVLRQINADNELKVGDKIIIRLVIKCDRDMEYIHLKDMRASAMEPDNVLSEYKWRTELVTIKARKMPQPISLSATSAKELMC